MTQNPSAKQLVLVTGATGNQGAAIAHQLIGRGKFKVRAMVRDQNKPAAQALQQAGAELVQADFNVRILAPFVGGGFGVKSPMWQNTMLCAAAAKAVGRPVKLALSREGVYRLVGGRTASEQRVALGANDRR